ncbi:MAG: hypothetical protein GVY33_11135 [Alphaproteobacteria bacterium]|nr:hypothetical protein [Alphaproteobacteria bacterium]
MHVACPQCGTGYQLSPATLERDPLRLRCRRCRHVWEPPRPLAGTAFAADATAAADETATPPAEPGSPAPAPAVAEPDEPAAAATPRRRRRGLALGLYALAAVLLVAGAGGFAWAYRDALSFAAAPRPHLVDVEPAWRAAAGGRRLVVAADVENPGPVAAEIRRVHVKFLSAQGAWIDQTVVEVPPLRVPAGASGRLEMAVDRLPEGTASLELSVVPDAPVS